MRVRSFGLWVAALLLSASPVFAQEATILGTVTDASKGVLPGVTVTATSLANGRTFTDVSNERGDITGEPLFAESKIMQIVPAMEDVFSYFVKNESGKEMKGGRISGSGQSTIKLEDLGGGKKSADQTAAKKE